MPACVEKGLRERFARCLDFEVGPDIVMVLDGMRFVGGRYPALIAADGSLLGDLSPDVWGAREHSVFSRVRFPRVRDLDGVTVVVPTPAVEQNYGHWMMDLLPRLLLVEMAGYGPGSVDRYLLNSGVQRYHRETLLAFGISADRMLDVGPAAHYRMERAVTATWRDWRFGFSPWILDRLPDRLMAGDAPRPGDVPGERIYLSREDALFRRVRNEIECVGVLREHGFRVYHPERDSVAEQARVFGAAGAVVSVHGSGLTNLMFCRRGTRVLEIFPENYCDYAMWTLASMKGLEYRVLQARAVGGAMRENSLGLRNRSDVWIDPGGLDRALAEMLG